MTKLYPTLIIPPIPSKQSIGEYAVKQGKAKEDVNMIARRRRMLQVFLNRIARHPILSTEYVFHRFLSADVSWVSLMMTAPFLNPDEPNIRPSPKCLTSHPYPNFLKIYSEPPHTTRWTHHQQPHMLRSPALPQLLLFDNPTNASLTQSHLLTDLLRIPLEIWRRLHGG